MVTTRTMRGALGAVAVVAAEWLGATEAPAVQAYAARYDYLCDPEAEGAEFVTWPPAGCCQATFGDVCTDAEGHPDVTERRNILLVVSDDQDYCLYGFMAGLCSDDPTQDCTEESDCGSSGRCVGSRDFGACTGDGTIACYDNTPCTSASAGTCDHTAPSGLRLRLNELTCRNRQPKRYHTDIEWCDPNDQYELNLDSNQLEFSREGAPCHRGTHEMPADLPPVMFTPQLDELATTGVVFPRAYLPGTICTNSRRAMLHGRHLRHMQWLWVGGKGAYECRRDAVADERKGCLAESGSDSSCTDTGECEAAHMAAWWLDSGRVNDPDDPSDVSLPTDNGYRRFAFGKPHVVKEGRGGFEPVGTSDMGGSSTDDGNGKIRCGVANSNCEDVLSMTTTELTAATIPYPTAEVFDVERRSHYELTEAIDETMHMDAGAPIQKQPTFLWWGPHIPHAGPVAESFLEDPYNTANLDQAAYQHYARVSWLDASFGGIVHHLRRACSCKPDASGARSLWDNTVVLFLTDQGFLLPQAKGTTHENTQRTPLIISTPETRDTDTENETPHVFHDELASSVDLLPTILAYAGEARYFAAGAGGNDNVDEYPLGRNLEDWIAAPDDPESWDRRRNLIFGEKLRSEGDGNTNVSGPSPRHIVTRPGLFGTCLFPYNFTDAASSGDPTASCVGNDICHVHPCLTDDDCKGFGSTGNKNLGLTYLGASFHCIGPGHAWVPEWKRCANRPWTRCDADSECAPTASPNWCSGGECQPGTDRRGFYNDFTGRDCTTAADCVPPGVCRPVMLKMEWSAASTEPQRIWDLDWDPDQTTNLLDYPDDETHPFMENDHPHIDGPLKTKLSACMGHFLKQLSANHYDWDNSGNTVKCPDDLRGWAPPDPE